MPTIDLREYDSERGFIIHFGGKPREIDAHTFAYSLLGFSEALKEINSQVNPGYSFELKIEAISEGSFRATLRESGKSLRNIFSAAVKNFVFPLLVLIAYDEWKSHEKSIEVSDDVVLIKTGDTTIVLPKSVFEQRERVKETSRIRGNINRAVEAVENDENVTDLSLYSELDKETPVLHIPRDRFAEFKKEIADVSTTEGTRVRDERVSLVILKVVFAKGNRKWEFVWNGIKISATVSDPIFLMELLSREHLIGNGDTLECDLEIVQEWDSSQSVWINKSYNITKVYRHIAAEKQRTIK